MKTIFRYQFTDSHVLFKALTKNSQEFKTILPKYSGDQFKIKCFIA